MKHTYRYLTLPILLVLLTVAACAQPVSQGGNVEAAVAAALRATGEAQSAQATIDALEAQLESADKIDEDATPVPNDEASAQEQTLIPLTTEEISQEAAVETAVVATRQAQDGIATSVAATLTVAVIDAPASTFTPTYTPIPSSTPTPLPDAVVNTKALNMRRGPDTVYGVVSSYGNGTEIKVLGRSQGGNWLQVQAPDGKTGWMSKRLLTINVATDGLVVAQAPPRPTDTPTATPHPPTTTPTPTPVVVIPPTDTPTPVPAASRYGEYAGTIGHYGGQWGDWGSMEYCSSGLARNFSVRVEGKQGRGDDTALNSIALGCGSATSNATHSITSSRGFWGDWSPQDSCPQGHFLASARLKIEQYTGDGDETGATDVEFMCTDGTYKKYPHEATWGDWAAWQSCPPPTAICGIRTRMHSAQSSGDNTTLNDVQFACCYAQ